MISGAAAYIHHMAGTIATIPCGFS